MAMGPPSELGIWATCWAASGGFGRGRRVVGLHDLAVPEAVDPAALRVRHALPGAHQPDPSLHLDGVALLAKAVGRDLDAPAGVALAAEEGSGLFHPVENLASACRRPELAVGMAVLEERLHAPRVAVTLER